MGHRKGQFSSQSEHNWGFRKTQLCFRSQTKSDVYSVLLNIYVSINYTKGKHFSFKSSWNCVCIKITFSYLDVLT